MNPETERRFIAGIVKDDTGDRWRECSQLDPEAFEDFEHRKTWRGIVAAKTYEEAAGVGLKYFAHPTMGTEYIEDRTAIWLGWLGKLGLDKASEWLGTLPVRGGTRFAASLDARRFSITAALVEPAPRFLINDRAVCTPGNLTNIIAQAKAGKTATIAAAIAAAICAEFDSSRDTLGITAAAPGSRLLLHFDTEQSPFDHHQLVRRAMRRAGVDSPPPWLASYGLAGFSAQELRRALVAKMKDASTRGGIFAVILDGTADLVSDVNDAGECNAFVAELHGLAIEHDCPILNVVHENPGQDVGKMRGHLGSQLERKAESNLRLRKSEEVTVIFSEKMRGAPILERDGPRFKWSDSEGMHVSCQNAGKTREDERREALHDQAESAFNQSAKDVLTWKEAVSAVGEKRLSQMVKLGVVSKLFGGSYRLAA